MRRIWLSLLAVVLVLGRLAGAQETRAQSKSVPDSINLIWKSVAKDFTALAAAMPEDKWAFKPTQGAFKDARTFAEQVKHVACANEACLQKIKKQKSPARCAIGGPNPAKSKAEILAYLRESFVQMDSAIASINTDNLLEQIHSEYWGDDRLSAITAAVWHISDHYGQLVEYLRMNGLVSPASQ